MSTANLNDVLRSLARGMDAEMLSDVPDRQLVERALGQRDPAALQAIVHRHGAMVYRVCWRVLQHTHDAEDAFQATFLVFAQKLRTVRKHASVASWLHGVAYRVAVKAKVQSAARRRRESRASVSDAMPPDEATWKELCSALDAELNQLPDRWRLPLVLCYLEGRTQDEAASQLAWSKSTLRRRLEEARDALALRLSKRGIALPAAMSAVLLSDCVTSAMPAPGLVARAVESAADVAAGKTLATVASATVAALAEGVMKAMLLTKLKAVVAVVLMLGFVATGVTIFTGRTAAGQDDEPAAEKPVEPVAKQEKDKEIVTAWGKEVGGLQAGLGYPVGQKRAYSHGETVKLVVRVRNVGKEEVKFQYLRQFFIEKPPTVTDGDGKAVTLEGVTAYGIHIPVDVKLAPGKEIELYELKFKLRPASESGNERFGLGTLDGTGKFQIQYERIIGMSSSGRVKPDPALGKLASGKLELEVKEPEKLPPEKEPFTAWGKEVGGLQAGLGFRPGERRAYHHGETVTLVVRVRNVGKETVKFEYIRQFLDENPPTVTDADGKTVPQPGINVLGGHPPVEVSLESGKETELESRLAGGAKLAGASGLRYELMPAMGTGKVSFQYERVFGDSSAGSIKLDPALSKLATGKLEVEIKPEPPKAKNAPAPKPLEAGKDSVFRLMYLRILEDDPRKVEDLKAIDEPSGKTVLAYALTKGYKRIAEHIVESGNAELGHADKSRDTPLHELMKTTDVALVKRIFEKYPQLARKGMLAENRSRWAPLDLLHYHHKPGSEMEKAVEAALDSPPNADRKVKIVRFRRLLDAISESDLNRMVQAIKEDKSLVNFVNPEGYPPLTSAGAGDNLAAVHVLLAYGADPLGNAQTTFSPVEWALAYKKPDVLRAMKIAGVSLQDRVRAFALPGEVGAMKTVAQLIEEYDRDNVFRQIFKE